MAARSRSKPGSASPGERTSMQKKGRYGLYYYYYYYYCYYYYYYYYDYDYYYY